MDQEETYLRVRAQLSGMLSPVLAPKISVALEYAYLAVAGALLCFLVVLHTDFVQQPGCSGELSGINITGAQLVQIKIGGAGFWIEDTTVQEMDFQKGSSSIETSAISDMAGDGFTTLDVKSWKNDKEFLVPQMENGSAGTAQSKLTGNHKEDFDTAVPVSLKFKIAVIHVCNNWVRLSTSIWNSTNQFINSANQLWENAGWKVIVDAPKFLQMLCAENLRPTLVQWLDKRSKASEANYLYTAEKGYFLLSDGEKFRQHIKTVNVTLFAQSFCFGNRWKQVLINTFIGYDTILMNSLLSSPGHGYLYNYQTKEFYDLNHGEGSEGDRRFGDFFVRKSGVLIMSLFIFFTTTMSISFILRETVSRMLKFTVQLQHHAHVRLPAFQLISVHATESLVFVPIMIGILFFLFEFYKDQLLAFLVLILVWLSELFTLISARTSISMQFFPQFFLLYFLIFHIYVFSYPYGFSYLAFSATAAFVLHLIFYFWNHFEVPSLQRSMGSGAQLPQQAGAQIARVNMLNNDMVDYELPSSSDSPLRSHHAASDTMEPIEVPGAQEFSASTTRQTEPTPDSGSSCPLGSLFRRFLRGASLYDITVFFSLFRDLQDQRQVY